MQLPGVPSLVFLAYILLFLPIASLRSGRQLRAVPASAVLRRAIWMGSLVNLLMMLGLAILVGRSFGYPFLARPRVDAQSVLAAVVALLACFALRAISQAIRSEEERRSMLVYLLVPHTARDWAVWTPIVFVAAISEELAYRGVGMSILWYSLGNPWLAAAISAIGFAAAHALQGWKSGAVIFGIALVMHALVASTGTLVYAMVVHAAYDLIAGYFIGREARAAI